ncbi:hypothetical protein ABRY23_13645 [Melioribacteraceae bacterium 4301-Me]|uniref:hypothetical protein n=1 Tax=Pyranulibacter aquaticus TaxID=3163344 RepID=UPI00359A7598
MKNIFFYDETHMTQLAPCILRGFFTDVKFVLISVICVLFFLLVNINLFAFGNNKLSKNDLIIRFNGDAKIEVGSYYTGLEFHHSYPVPQRFSFFYPIANSIDLSTDYWKRDTTFVMDVGLKFGESKIEWLNNKSFVFDLTPFSVDFFKNDNEKRIEISYAFTKNKPAFVISYSITNRTNQNKTIELYTKQALAFRTSHTYKLSENVNSQIFENGETVFINHNDYETQNACMFIVNGNELPVNVQFFNRKSGSKGFFKESLTKRKFVDAPSLNFVCKKNLKPNERLIVTQIIGTCKSNESKQIVSYLKDNYKKEINGFENAILKKISENLTFKTSDKILDHSVLWSKAILEANKHYIDGNIMPMPCPAEYNFYFTHDVLMTDLAAVNFDIERVKNDMRFIIKLANKEKIIPHAYYWKDSSFVTEFADHDNWNNCWFIIVSAGYLKHSNDKKFLVELYPFIEKALTQALKTKGNDDLMWSFRPDWWDIGKKYGQRSYMTILAIKAIRSFIYLSTVLNKNTDKLFELEQLAKRMTKNLNEKLWREEYGYLMNCSTPDTIDEHYYSGSLLAAHYGLIDGRKITNMIETANKKIVDKKVGVYTVYPMDFDKLGEFWHFAGNEAGDKFYYLNGGIWQHSNSWYALALIADDKKENAAQFIKNVMTIDGIMNGPNGQPAMYEVRNGNFNDPKVYGTIDKPQFMWAAGWYLYSLYYLFGLNDNEWNIEFNPYLLEDQQHCFFDLQINNKLVKVEVARDKLQKIRINGADVNSLIIPNRIKDIKKIELTIGKLETPLLKTTTSVLKSCTFHKRTNEMKIILQAFKGHNNKTVIESQKKPKIITLNGHKLENIKADYTNGEYLTTINFTHENKNDIIRIEY